MILYRFTHQQFSHDISGEGARLFGGRWNSKGQPVVYTSMTISLSLVELLVHCGDFNQIKSNELVRIEVPGVNVADIPGTRLHKNWQTDIEYCRFIGDSFLTSRKSLVFKVPSVIIPEEYNILINPGHPGFKKVVIKSAGAFAFDERLFKK